ncbi:MAG: tRNA (N(6)-L-threonylcarbamoyladenosine(37)-C(2))-methylthiotransferase MtaB [Clostridia bacterium]|nr:tRNA (N(6)-L-threonylcarbamoyladenosine(37)-C(2))-methylthiotransferase MtaB [Clostridia bacterium]
MLASIITLGCKVNEYESQAILTELKSAGWDITEGLVRADLYIVNTCAVTNMAERKSRQMLTKINKLNPDAKIVVVGCAVQNNPEQFQGENIISLIGNQGKDSVVECINCKSKKLQEINHIEFEEMKKPTETTSRQFVKIQDGCNNFCTYCIIPYLRGRSRSRELSSILNEIKSTKCSEVVLTGINMSDYRIDGNLALKTVVKEVDKLDKRFRISSLECNVLDDEMLDILADCKNFCPHFHLSLQSACNETLKRMNRHYTIEEFKSIVRKIKIKFPSAFIATDIIVGFKGETDEEFETTLNNLKEIKFDFMHIFPYSERAGTVAIKLPNSVDKSIVKQRESKLIELNQGFIKACYEKNLNSKHKVLIEINENGKSYGYTENYVYTEIDKIIEVGKIVNVKLTEILPDGMKGEIYG